jgi:hypothetical protein
VTLPTERNSEAPNRLVRFFSEYSWWLGKNILGWLLILLAWPIGILLPGPGGIPIFLIGFALVTFPGKRRLTARVLKGVPMRLSHRFFSWLTAFLAVTVPALAFWILEARESKIIAGLVGHPAGLVAAYGLSIAAAWVLAWLTLRLTNLIIRLMPVARRKVRPWLRRQGIHLLPPRRQQQLDGEDESILEFRNHFHEKRRAVWKRAKPILRRSIGLIITGLVLIWFARRITQQWGEIRANVVATSITRIVIASVMFAIFLFVFRALVWWRLLIGFGYRLPIAPAVRIWSMSELAR